MNTETHRGIRRFFHKECLKFFKKFAKTINSETGGALLVAFYSPGIPEEENHIYVKSTDNSEEFRLKLEMELLRRLKVSMKGVVLPKEAPFKGIEPEDTIDYDSCPECEKRLVKDFDRKLAYCPHCNYSREIGLVEITPTA